MKTRLTSLLALLFLGGCAFFSSDDEREIAPACELNTNNVPLLVYVDTNRIVSVTNAVTHAVLAATNTVTAVTNLPPAVAAKPPVVQTKVPDVKVKPPAQPVRQPTTFIKAKPPVPRPAPPSLRAAPIRMKVRTAFPVRQCPSPNFDERKRGINTIVLHYTAIGSAKMAIAHLCNQKVKSRVSAHYVVDVDGSIYQLVDESKRAWHAGLSSWKGKDDVNSSSIGIEIVHPGHNANGWMPSYPEKQTISVIRLCKDIMRRYRITDVVGHSDIAPARKTDPGERFPWRRLARHGIGDWTDSYRPTTSDISTLLRQLGYNTSNLFMAVRAFRMHYHPEGLVNHSLPATLARAAALVHQRETARKTSAATSRPTPATRSTSSKR